MTFLTPLRTYLENLSQKELNKVIAGFLIFLLCIAGYLLYRRQTKIQDLTSRLQTVNKERVKTQRIIQAHTALKNQRRDVDVLLDQDKNFRLLDYFNTLTSQLGLVNAGAPVVGSPRDLDIGYNEIELTASFSSLTMVQLVSLLESLDKNKRIYTKDLLIEKSQKTPSIDVKIVIATLEPLIKT